MRISDSTSRAITRLARSQPQEFAKCFVDAIGTAVPAELPHTMESIYSALRCDTMRLSLMVRSIETLDRKIRVNAHAAVIDKAADVYNGDKNQLDPDSVLRLMVGTASRPRVLWCFKKFAHLEHQQRRCDPSAAARLEEAMAKNNGTASIAAAAALLLMWEDQGPTLRRKAMVKLEEAARELPDGAPLSVGYYWPYGTARDRYRDAEQVVADIVFGNPAELDQWMMYQHRNPRQKFLASVLTLTVRSATSKTAVLPAETVNFVLESLPRSWAAAAAVVMKTAYHRMVGYRYDDTMRSYIEDALTPRAAIAAFGVLAEEARYFNPEPENRLLNGNYPILEPLLAVLLSMSRFAAENQQFASCFEKQLENAHMPFVEGLEKIYPELSAGPKDGCRGMRDRQPHWQLPHKSAACSNRRSSDDPCFACAARDRKPLYHERVRQGGIVTEFSSPAIQLLGRKGYPNPASARRTFAPEERRALLRADADQNQPMLSPTTRRSLASGLGLTGAELLSCLRVSDIQRSRDRNSALYRTQDADNDLRLCESLSGYYPDVASDEILGLMESADGSRQTMTIAGFLEAHRSLFVR